MKNKLKIASVCPDGSYPTTDGSGPGGCCSIPSSSTNGMTNSCCVNADDQTTIYCPPNQQAIDANTDDCSCCSSPSARCCESGSSNNCVGVCCQSGQTCYQNTCVANNCGSTYCDNNHICSNGSCISCPSGQKICAGWPDFNGLQPNVCCPTDYCVYYDNLGFACMPSSCYNNANFCNSNNTLACCGQSNTAGYCCPEGQLCIINDGNGGLMCG